MAAADYPYNFGYLLVGCSFAGQFYNLLNIIASYFVHRVVFTRLPRAVVSLVLEVPASCIPPEIAQPIISTNPIIVGCLKTFRRRANESSQNKSMH